MRERAGHFVDLLLALTRKELQLRYRGTALGVMWSLANPLALALVLHFALKRVIQLDVENYAIFLLSALFAWQWLSNSIVASALTFTHNGGMIRKLAFDRYMLCAAVVLGDLIHFCVSIAVFAAFRIFSGLEPVPLAWLVGVPLLIAIQSAALLGAVLAIATTNAFVRDIDQLVRLALLLLFYLTPILYPLSMVPESALPLVLANPFGPLMAAWRALLLDGQLSSYIGLAAGYAVLSLAIGTLLYRRLSWRLAEVV